MSERLFKFYLSELKTVRIICPNADCKASVELEIDKLATRFTNKTPSCPVCGKDFEGLDSSSSSGQQNAFVRLANAIKELQGDKSNKGGVKIEFALPDRD